MIQNGNTTRPLLFLLVESADHLTGLTGASPTVTLSKNGGTFAAPAGAVSEIGSGWYKVAANATDAGTNGPLLLHATASLADPTDDRFEVVAFNPDDAVHLGLSAMPNAAAGSAGGLPTVDANNNIHGVQPGTGTGQLNPSAGKVPATVASGDYAGNTPQTGDSFARIGATGSGLTSLAPASTALSTAQWTNALATAINTLAGHDPGGTLASAASQTSILNAVSAITTNTARTGITVPQFVPLPASGTSSVRVKVKLFNLQGALEDADTNTVTVHAADHAGTSLDTNLSSTTATRDSAGQYHVDYTVHSSDTEGGVYIAVTYTVGGVSMAADAVFAVAQADTVTSIASILSAVNTINTNVGTAGAGLTAIGDARLAHLDADVSSRLATSGYTTPPTAAAIATAIFTDATASDFTVNGTPGKILVGQLGGAFTSTTSSVFTTAALANGPSGSGGGASAAAIATALWQDLLSSSDFTTAGSVGQKLASIKLDGSGDVYAVDQFGNQLASLAQVSNGTGTGAAFNVYASSETLSIGTDTGGLANTFVSGGSEDTWTAAGGLIQGMYVFDLSSMPGAVPVAVYWLGYYVGAGTASVSAYNWGTTVYDQIGSIPNVAGSSQQASAVFSLTNAYVGTGTNAGKVQIRFAAGPSATSLNTDRIVLGCDVTPPTHWSSMAIDASGFVTFNNSGVATAASQASILSAVGSPMQAGSAVALTSGERSTLAGVIMSDVTDTVGGDVVSILAGVNTLVGANAVETGLGLLQSQRIILAGVCGVLTTAGQNPEVYKNPEGTATRISVANDAAGNRTAVTLTP